MVSSPAAGSGTEISRTLFAANAPGAASRHSATRTVVDALSARRLTTLILRGEFRREAGDSGARVPRLEHEADARSLARGGNDLETAAEHLHALHHACETEPPVRHRLELRGLAVEATAVVFDGDLDRTSTLD